MKSTISRRKFLSGVAAAAVVGPGIVEAAISGRPVFIAGEISLELIRGDPIYRYVNRARLPPISWRGINDAYHVAAPDEHRRP